MNRAVVVGAAVCGILVIPVAAVLGVFALTGVGGGVVLAACATSATGGGALEIVHANLYTGMTADEFASDLQTVVAGRPDVVTLNEAYRRSTTELSPPGYAHFRGERPREAREAPVLWRTDTWQSVDAGTVLMHRRPVRWGTRYVNWVTLHAPATGAVVSVVSGHASPAGPGRTGLLAEFVARLDALIRELAPRGPVLVGADLNTHYPRSEFLRDWLAGSGARSTFDLLGQPQGGWATGDRGGTIDYILLAGDATAVAHRTDPLISDHHLLAATIDLGDRAPDSRGTDSYALGPVQPELRALVEVLAPLFGIGRIGGYRKDAVDPAGHPAGLAADFMVTSRGQGHELAAYAKAHAADLGIDYIIWWQRIWSVGRADDGWRPMADRGSPTENHRDHVHINVVDDQGTVPISHPSCVPTAGEAGDWQPPLSAAPVTSPYGWRVHPITKARSFHSGIDYGAPCGTPFVAAAEGTVSYAGSDPVYGHLIQIDHGGGVVSRYGHMAGDGVYVRAGDVVGAGHAIGAVGSAGLSTGCHLHFEIAVTGDTTDPQAWLAHPPSAPPGRVAGRRPRGIARRRCGGMRFQAPPDRRRRCDAANKHQGASSQAHRDGPRRGNPGAD